MVTMTCDGMVTLLCEGAIAAVEVVEHLRSMGETSALRARDPVRTGAPHCPLSLWGTLPPRMPLAWEALQQETCWLLL